MSHRTKKGRLKAVPPACKPVGFPDIKLMTLTLDNIYALHDSGFVSDKFLQEYEDIMERTKSSPFVDKEQDDKDISPKEIEEFEL